MVLLEYYAVYIMLRMKLFHQQSLFYFFVCFFTWRYPLPQLLCRYNWNESCQKVFGWKLKIIFCNIFFYLREILELYINLISCGSKDTPMTNLKVFQRNSPWNSMKFSPPEIFCTSKVCPRKHGTCDCLIKLYK